jgi:hypothetical protein
MICHFYLKPGQLYMRLFYILLFTFFIFSSCREKSSENSFNGFFEVGSIDIGDTGAAEITAFDAVTSRLFVVNNSGKSRIDVIDLKDPANMKLIHSIDLKVYGGLINSVAVYKGVLAAAVEAADRQKNGSIVLFNTSDYSLIHSAEVGPVPDMVCFSPDGNFILSANEGEPSQDNKTDPPGSLSIIDIKNKFSVSNLNFASFKNQIPSLIRSGLRITGATDKYENDLEPEYITISPNSEFAWVTLQENNAVAKIDLQSKSLTGLFPLGYKNYNLPENAIDVNDTDSTILFSPHPVFGMYMPDAIANFESGANSYLIIANEGDTREYKFFTENRRLNSVKLDPAKFPNAAELQSDKNLGRLIIDPEHGDTDKDGDIDSIFSFGGRGFSILDGNSGKMVWDSKNELDRITRDSSRYNDQRSDDKSIEAEAVVIGKSGNNLYAFIGLDRTNAVAIYDINDPLKPVFSQLLKTGDGPEGLIFIKAEDSPTGKPLLVVSSEYDGLIKVFSPGL